MYEGSIATVALLKGYQLTQNQNYLLAARKFCDYLLSKSYQSNANFSGFAVWSLSEYIKYHDLYNESPIEIEEYLDHVLGFFDRLHSFQEKGGYWSDYHNQYIWYHGIIARGLVNLQAVMEAKFPDHPKLGVVKHAVYKALNHIIRSQELEGKVWQHPYQDLPHRRTHAPVDAILMANRYLYPENKTLDESLKLFTEGVVEFPNNEFTQGHYFATFGRMLSYYYVENSCTSFEENNMRVSKNTIPASLMKSELFIYPNPANESFYLKGEEGSYKIFDSTGRLLFRNHLEPGLNNSSGIPDGVYFIRGQHTIKKLIIAH